MFDSVESILIVSLIGLIILLYILYEIIRAAVKSGIVAAHKQIYTKPTPPAPLDRNRDFTTEQAALYSRYEKGDISYEEYNEGWKKAGH